MVIDFDKAKQAFVDAKEIRLLAEKKLYNAQKEARFYGQNFFSDSRLTNDLKAAQKAEFFSDCDFNTAAQMRIDGCLASMRSGGLIT